MSGLDIEMGFGMDAAAARASKASNMDVVDVGAIAVETASRQSQRL
jgi:hypothetical protein